MSARKCTAAADSLRPIRKMKRVKPLHERLDWEDKTVIGFLIGLGCSLVALCVAWAMQGK